MEALVLCVTTRAARGVEFHKFGGTEIAIGRGLRNDLIVADPYFGAEQFRIRRGEDGMTLVLLDRTNVPRLNGERVPAGGELPLREGDRLALGGTLITVLTEDSAVAPARVLGDSLWSRIERWRPGIALLVLLLAGAASALLQYLEVVRDIEWPQFAAGPVMLVVMLLVWSFAWALAGRLLRNQTHFFAHLACAAGITLASMLASELLGVAAWASGLTQLLGPVDGVISAGFGCLLLGLNLRFATNLHRPLAAATLFVLALGGLSWGLQWQSQEEFEPSPAEPAGLLPPFAKLRGDLPVAEHERLLRELFGEVREDVLAPRAEDGAKD